MDLCGIARQGLDQAQTQFEKAAGRLAAAGTTPAGAMPAGTTPAGSVLTGTTLADPGDSADLSQAAVNLLAARNAFEINLKLIQTGDEMARRAIDLLG